MEQEEEKQDMYTEVADVCRNAKLGDSAKAAHSGGAQPAPSLRVRQHARTTTVTYISSQFLGFRFFIFKVLLRHVNTASTITTGNENVDRLCDVFKEKSR